MSCEDRASWGRVMSYTERVSFLGRCFLLRGQGQLIEAVLCLARTVPPEKSAARNVSRSKGFLLLTQDFMLFHGEPNVSSSACTVFSLVLLVQIWACPSLRLPHADAGEKRREESQPPSSSAPSFRTKERIAASLLFSFLLFCFSFS
jgi:hypothetical protein